MKDAASAAIVADAACVDGDVVVASEAGLRELNALGNTARLRFITGTLHVGSSKVPFDDLGGRGAGAIADPISLTMKRLRKAEISVFSFGYRHVTLDFPALEEGGIVSPEQPTTVSAPLLQRATNLKLKTDTMSFPALQSAETIELRRESRSDAFRTAKHADRKAEPSQKSLAKTMTLSLPALTTLGSLIVKVELEPNYSKAAAVADTWNPVVVGTAPTEVLRISADKLAPFDSILAKVERAKTIHIFADGDEVTFPALVSVGNLTASGIGALHLPVLRTAKLIQARAPNLQAFSAPQLEEVREKLDFYDAKIGVLALPAVTRIGSLTFAQTSSITRLDLPQLRAIENLLLVENSRLERLDAPLLVDIETELKVHDNPTLSTLVLTNLAYVKRATITNNPLLPLADAEHVRPAVAMENGLTVCGCREGPPCQIKPTPGSEFRPVSSNGRRTTSIRQSGVDVHFLGRARSLSPDSFATLVKALGKPRGIRILDTITSGVAIGDDASGRPTKYAVFDSVPIDGMQIRRMIEVGSFKPGLVPRDAKIAAFISSGFGSYNPGPWLAASSRQANGDLDIVFLSTSPMRLRGRLHVDKAELARFEMGSFPEQTTISVHSDEDEGTVVHRLAHTPGTPNRPPLLFRLDDQGQFRVDAAFLITSPVHTGPRRFESLMQDMPRPPPPAEQDPVSAAVAYGGCRIALPIPPCPDDTKERLTNTGRSCTDDDGKRQGTEVTFADNACVTLSTPASTPAPFVAITKMGAFVDDKQDGVWHRWTVSPDGMVTAGDTTSYRRGRIHGVGVRRIGGQEQVTRTYLAD